LFGCTPQISTPQLWLPPRLKHLFGWSVALGSHRKKAVLRASNFRHSCGAATVGRFTAGIQTASKSATLIGSNIMLLLICNCSFFSFLGGMQTLASKHKVWIHSKADSGNILTY